MTLIQDIEPDLSPAEQRAADADLAVSEALAAVHAADDRLEAARAADAADSTAASRSELAKARRQRAATADALIEAEERFAREVERLDDGDRRAEASARQQAEAEVAWVRTTIRAAIVELLGAAPALSRLRAAQSQASLPQLDAGLERELHDLLNAGRHLREGLDRAWPKPSSEGEVTGG